MGLGDRTDLLPKMAPHQSKSILPDHLMHRNQLQEYTQKSALPQPVYQISNQGFPHAPKFTATVLVDGKKYTSMRTFSRRKEAEQEVAKYAFECTMKRVNDQGCDLTHQDTLFCKSILHEFAVKTNLNPPIYTTTLPEETRPVFVSSLVLDGNTYTGEVAGSKKMAEQLAGRAAIQSLLGSDSGTVLREIIRVKRKRSASLHKEGSSQQIWTNIPASVIGFNCEDKTFDPSYVGKRKLEMEKPEQKKMRVLD